MDHFTLKKWYLDVVDDRGHVFIGYWLVLTWQAVSITAFQNLWHVPNLGVKSRSGLTRQPPPSWETDHELRWRIPHLQGSWTSAATALKKELLWSQQGNILWHCTQPKAGANVSGPEIAFSGWGYTECIDITIPIWKLPLTGLYWGRCHTGNHYLVWIRWEGTTRQNILWHNGIAHKEALISDTCIQSEDIFLKLPQEITLRRGNLLSTVFKPFKNIIGAIPNKALDLNESKWYGNSILETKNGSEPATVIFEKVTWSNEQQ